MLLTYIPFYLKPLNGGKKVRKKRVRLRFAIIRVVIN